MSALPWVLAASAEITAAADDFGRVVHEVPAWVARPADAMQVAALARYAAAEGLAFRPRGCGHSVYGQAQADSGIVCYTGGLDQMYDISGGTLDAGAGTRWRAVLAAATRKGMTPPVLADYLDLSVGGTLSAGGIGGASHHHGPQVDHILDLEVVTPSGEIIRCSASSHPDVFFGVLAGHGTAGIITRATIPLVPAPTRVRRYKIPCPTAATLIACQRSAARDRRFSYLEGQIAADQNGRWSYVLEAGAFYTAEPPADAALLDALSLTPGPAEIEDLDYLSFCDRMQDGVRLLAASGDWYRPHPWLSVFLPMDAAEQYVAGALDRLTPATAGPIPMLLYPLRRGEVPAPGLATPPGDDDGLFCTFSILRTVPDDRDAINAALDDNQRLATAAIEVGGTVYPISAVRSLAGQVAGTGNAMSSR